MVFESDSFNGTDALVSNPSSTQLNVLARWERSQTLSLLVCVAKLRLIPVMPETILLDELILLRLSVSLGCMIPRVFEKSNSLAFIAFRCREVIAQLLQINFSQRNISLGEGLVVVYVKL